MAKLSSLTNAFVSGLSNPPWASANAAGGSFSAVGQLVLNVPVNTVSSAASLVTYSGGYIYWDITESYIVVQVVNAGTQNATLELWCPQLVDSSGNWFGWHITNGQIQVDYEGTIVASAAYSATTHAWLRIRETASTTYYDYSSDGLNWTNLTSYADSAHTYVATAVYPNFYLGSNSSGTNPASSAILDNLNLPPVPTQIPDYAVTDNLPAPLTSGTTIQSFTDVGGEIWVAKNGVNGGTWNRARDVLKGIITRTAALNMPTATTGGGGIIAFDTVAKDVYGMYTGASNYGYTAFIGGWYQAFVIIQTICTVANAFIQGSIKVNNTTLWSSDNEFSALASGGGLLWRSSALLFLNAGDIVNVVAYNAQGFAVSAGASVTHMDFEYVGSG
jgi:hypothetical protein